MTYTLALVVPLGKGDRPLPDGRGSDWLPGGWCVRWAGDSLGADAEVPRGYTDLHRAKDGRMGQDVAFLAQKDETVPLDGLDVMDGEVLRRAAYDAGGQFDAPGFDQLG